MIRISKGSGLFSEKDMIENYNKKLKVQREKIKDLQELFEGEKLKSSK